MSGRIRPQRKEKRAASPKGFRPNTASKPNETAMCPPTTISKAPINAKSMSGNLFEDRNWLLPPNYLNYDDKNATGITSPEPPVKEEPKIGEQSIISLKADKCGWGPDCSFCKNQDKEEDWDGSHQNKLQWKTTPQPEIQRPQARCPETLNYEDPQNSQKPNKETQISRYPSQTKVHKQWEAEMERLNTKYNLDCF